MNWQPSHPEEAMREPWSGLEQTPGNTVFIGDQLFTDIWGAKNAGLRNILVKPINPKEEIQIVLKRYLERIVLHFYTKEEKNS
ncbi:MAG: HAD hydrolase-like protein [Ruminococcus sp.]